MQKKMSERCEWIPAAIAAGATLFAGGANILSNNYANKRNWARQQAINEANYKAQKEFYQNSIKWRKEDALRSGINPIYALGAAGANFSPSYQANSDTPNDYSFIGNAAAQAITTYQAQKEFELKKQGMQSEIKVNTARASYYNALAKNAQEKQSSKGTGTATQQTGTEKKAAFTQYQQKENIGVIDPNSQISQESASDGIGFGIELISGSKSRAAQRGLELFNQNKLNYPYYERDPKEGGRYILKDAKNFKDWLYKMGVAKSWDYDFHKFWNWMDNKFGRGGMTDEQLQQTFIRETLDWQANNF